MSYKFDMHVHWHKVMFNDHMMITIVVSHDEWVKCDSIQRFIFNDILNWNDWKMSL